MRRDKQRQRPLNEAVLILFKVHGSGSNAVLAVCDKELCGKTLKEGAIEFVVSEAFYKGKEISRAALKRKLHEFGNVNIVGNKAVSVAVEENLVSGESALLLGKEKHVQIFKI